MLNQAVHYSLTALAVIALCALALFAPDFAHYCAFTSAIFPAVLCGLHRELRVDPAPVVVVALVLATGAFNCLAFTRAYLPTAWFN